MSCPPSSTLLLPLASQLELVAGVHNISPCHSRTVLGLVQDTTSPFPLFFDLLLPFFRQLTVFGLLHYSLPRSRGLRSFHSCLPCLWDGTQTKTLQSRILAKNVFGSLASAGTRRRPYEPVATKKYCMTQKTTRTTVIWKTANNHTSVTQQPCVNHTMMVFS